MTVAATKQMPLKSGFGPKSTAREVLAGLDLTGKIAIVTRHAAFAKVSGWMMSPVLGHGPSVLGATLAQNPRHAEPWRCGAVGSGSMLMLR